MVMHLSRTRTDHCRAGVSMWQLGGVGVRAEVSDEWLSAQSEISSSSSK